jgi:hypothetical protein
MMSSAFAFIFSYQNASECKWRDCRLCRGVDLPHAKRARVCLKCDCKDGAPSGVGKKGHHKKATHNTNTKKTGNIPPPIGTELHALDNASLRQREERTRDSDEGSTSDSVEAILKAGTKVSKMPSPITRTSLLSLSSTQSPREPDDSDSAIGCTQEEDAGASKNSMTAALQTSSPLNLSPLGNRREKLKFKSLLVSSSSSSDDDDALLPPVSSPLRTRKPPVQIPGSHQKNPKKPTRRSLCRDRAAPLKSKSLVREPFSVGREYSSSNEIDDDDALLHMRLPWAKTPRKAEPAAPAKRILAMAPAEGRCSPRSPPFLRASSASKAKKCRRSPNKGLGVAVGTTTPWSSESD